MEQNRIFLLSPASSGGKRAALLLNDRATFDIAKRVRSDEGARRDQRDHRQRQAGDEHGTGWLDHREQQRHGWLP